MKATSQHMEIAKRKRTTAHLPKRHRTTTGKHQLDKFEVQMRSGM